MSVTQAMYSGVSGIAAEGDALGVVGDNISNVNTVGFKAQRGIFEDVLGHAIGEKTLTAGSGVRMAQVQQLFTQGTLNTTGVGTDIALDGNGFLVVSGNVGGTNGTYFTRAGQTRLDKDGFLVNPDGLQLQGYQANPNGTFAVSLSSIKVPTNALSPLATTSLAVVANLDANATTPADPPNTPNPGVFDPQAPGPTSNFSTAITAYDSVGKAHPINVYFRKTGINAWEYHATVPWADLDPSVQPSAGNPPPANTEIGAGTLTFTASGALNVITPLAAAAAPNGTGAQPTSASLPVTFAGATAQTVALDFGSPITPPQGSTTVGTGLNGLTQFSTPSNVTSQSQNGYGSGDLAGISIDSLGVLRGNYSNGQKIAIGQIAIAKFNSNEGLARTGHGLWVDTRASGTAAIGAPGTGGRAAIQGGMLEQSNVDIAQQFVDMIQHQRGFQANSKTITTADEMLQEVVNLKR